MPALEIADRRDTVVVFDFLGHNRFGDPVFANPREISVRWEDSSLEQLSNQETVYKYDVTIYTNEELLKESLVAYGTLLTYADAPRFFQVANVSKTNDLKKRFTQYDAGLLRYTEGMPTIAGTI